jgi:hypothetical protein
MQFMGDPPLYSKRYTMIYLSARKFENRPLRNFMCDENAVDTTVFGLKQGRYTIHGMMQQRGTGHFGKPRRWP